MGRNSENQAAIWCKPHLCFMGNVQTFTLKYPFHGNPCPPGSSVVVRVAWEDEKHAPRARPSGTTSEIPWPSENNFWLVVSTPLKNISQLGWLFPIYGKIKFMFQTTNQNFKSHGVSCGSNFWSSEFWWHDTFPFNSSYYGFVVVWLKFC